MNKLRKQSRHSGRWRPTEDASLSSNLLILFKYILDHSNIKLFLSLIREEHDKRVAKEIADKLERDLQEQQQKELQQSELIAQKMQVCSLGAHIIYI